jgi:hypothetical protein
MGIRGLVPGFLEPPKALCDVPSVEPPAGLGLPRAWADKVFEVLYVIKATWPRVLTPNDAAPASGVDTVVPHADEVRSNRASVLGMADVAGRTFGSADLLTEGPSRALSSGRSSFPSTGAEAALDAREVIPRRRVPIGTACQGSAQGKSRCHIMT